MTTVIKFENVSKKYKLYSKGGLYLRDRITHALERWNPFNGEKGSAFSSATAVADSKALSLGSEHSLEKDFWALKNVSFEIKQGESVGFIGRNGAGKSTILKLLAGVTKANSGNVEVNGKVAALIEVGAGFHPELTGRENIFLNGSILGMSKAEIQERCDSIVAFAEIEQFMDTPVKHYSSGMYVRLGFAIAAHTNPDIYLIDEVLAVGDEAFQEKCFDVLAAHKAAGKTMILVSHGMDDVAAVCDRCVYVNHGQVGFDGPSQEAIQQYRADLNYRANERESNAWSSSEGAINGANFQPSTKSAGEKGIFLLDRSIKRRPGCKPIIQRVRLLDARDAAKDHFVVGEQMTIEFTIEPVVALDRPTFGIGLDDYMSTRVLSLTTEMISEQLPPLRETCKVVCRVQSLPLMPGQYMLSLAVGTRSRPFLDALDHAVSFTVETGDLFPHLNNLPRGLGRVFVKPVWKALT